MKGVRKLACLSTGVSVGVFTAHYLIADDKLIFTAICCLVLAAASFLTKGGTRKRVFLICLGAAVGLMNYKLNCDLVLSPTEELDGKTLKVTAEVLDYPEYRESSVLLTVKLSETELPQSETLIVSYDKEQLDFAPGDVIKAELSFSSAVERFGEYSDLNIAKGLTAVTRLSGEAKLISHNDELRYFPQKLADSLRGIIKSIFPQDTEAFMCALLTGDRSGLYTDTELDTAMAISGIMHVVAVSGMHVAFLVGFLQLILGQNRRLSLICIPTIWVFVLMVGAPASAVRAGVMQTMLLMAPIFRRENDSLTSLSFALAVILLHNPFACGSVGLQLSFGAMAGIMLFSQPIYEKLRRRYIKMGRVGEYVLATLSSSLSVSVFSVPLIALHFGYVSIYSALTNILCLWIVSLLFCGGLVLCLLSLISGAVGCVLAELLSWGVRYIGFTVKLISKLPYAALYVENIGVIVWLFAGYIAFGIAALRKGKGLLKATVFTVAALAILIVGTQIVSRNDTGTIAALNVGNGQCIVFTSKNSSVAVDCGSARTSVNAGDELTKYLGARGRDTLDCLVLTHLDDDHVNGIRELLCLVRVEKLVMPKSAKYGSTADNYRELRTLARQYGTEIELVNRETEMSFGDTEIRIYTPYRRGSSSNNKGLLLTVSVGGCNTLITGDAGAVVERELTNNYDLSDTDILVAGHHGSAYSTSTELVSEARPKAAIISVGNNSYGHPAYRVLTLLEVYGAEIHRTDLDGRVVIKAS